MGKGQRQAAKPERGSSRGSCQGAQPASRGQFLGLGCMLPQLCPADGPPRGHPPLTLRGLFLRTPVTLPSTAHTGSLICHPTRLGATSDSFLCL